MKKTAANEWTLRFNTASTIAAASAYALNEELFSNPSVVAFLLIAQSLANEVLRFKTNSAVTLS